MNNLSNIKCANPILISGCGGGYDIFTGLPIYFALKKKYKSIYLANFSFTKLELLSKHQQLSTYVYLINPGENITTDTYFPEQLLANKLNIPIIAFAYEKGVVALEKSYQDVINLYNIKTIILADGGCDSILFGYEKELATPVEDMMSIYVVNKLLNDKIISEAYLSILGITADFFEGVDPVDVENNIQYLINENALVAQYQLNTECPISNEYVDTFLACHPSKSIVNCCIMEGIDGNFGKVHCKYLGSRLKDKINISPLTSTQYVFKLSIVANAITYLHLLQNVDDSDEIDEIIIACHELIMTH